MANPTLHRLFPILSAALGFVLAVWGLALIVTGHGSAQSYSLLGVGAAVLGSSGVTWRRR